MKTIKRILGVILTIILVTIFTFNVYNLINIKIFKNDISPVLGYTMLEVVSGSMEPTIHVGDMIIIDTTDREYKENDIVTYKDKNDALVTHRIISLNGTEMITKGDNNDSQDPPYDTSRIVGKYVTKINNLGRLLAAFKSPLTMFLILVIGILTCILVSTDKEGNPLIAEEEKEFEEFLKAKNENKIEKDAIINVETKSKKPTNSKKTVTAVKKATKVTNASKKTGEPKKKSTASGSKNKTPSNKKIKGSKASQNAKKTSKTNTKK